MMTPTAGEGGASPSSAAARSSQLSGRAGWQTTGLVALAALVVQAFAYLRDVALAYQAGASSFSDVVFVGITIPTIIISAFSIGVLVPIVVETVGRSLSTGQDTIAWNTASAILNLVILLTIPIIGLTFLFTSHLVDFLAPGLDADAKVTSALVLQLGAVAASFSLISAWANGILNASGRFFLAAAAPAAVHIPVFVSILAFFHFLGPSAVGVGLLAGAMLQVLILVPVVSVTTGFRYRLTLRAGEGSNDFWKPAVSMLAVLALGQIYLIIERSIASQLTTGGISLLSYALKLTQWPVTLFALPVGVTALPLFADLQSQRSSAMLRGAVLTRLRWVMVFSVPLMGWLIVASDPLADVVYRRGALSSDDADVIGQLVVLYALGLPWLSCSTILLRAGLAVRILWFLPMSVALAAGIYATSAFYFSPLIGIAGLAISLSIYHFAFAGLLYFGLYRWLKPFNIGASGAFVARLGVAAGLSIATMQLVAAIWPASVITGQFGQLGLLLATAAAGGLTLLGIGHLVNLAEARRVIGYSAVFASRWLARAANQSEQRY